MREDRKGISVTPGGGGADRGSGFTCAILEPMLSMVEQRGAEISVTLLVGGVVITGMLTPRLRYVEWAAHQFGLAQAFGGAFHEMGDHVPPISAEETERVRALHRERVLDAGGDPDFGEAPTLSYDIVCLCNAVVQIGPADGGCWRHYPFLAFAPYAVQACVPYQTAPLAVIRPAPDAHLGPADVDQTL